MAVILVGAMIVAGIETVWNGQVTPKFGKRTKQILTTDFSQPISLAQGEEMGRFKLGSTVILLFPNEQIQLNDFSNNSTIKNGANNWKKQLSLHFLNTTFTDLSTAMLC